MLVLVVVVVVILIRVTVVAGHNDWWRWIGGRVGAHERAEQLVSRSCLVGCSRGCCGQLISRRRALVVGGQIIGQRFAAVVVVIVVVIIVARCSQVLVVGLDLVIIVVAAQAEPVARPFGLTARSGRGQQGAGQLARTATGSDQIAQVLLLLLLILLLIDRNYW